MIDCDHRWNGEKETRFCLKCGQVRTFPAGDKNGSVLWQGFEETRKPTELTSEEKNIIAHLANELGLKKAVDCLGISMVILRAWQGSYCRVKKLKIIDPKLDQPTDLSKEVEIDEPVKIKRKYDMSKRTPISPSSPLSTEVKEDTPLVSLGTFEVAKDSGLPPFPAFNDKWEPLVQLEWLVTYLELAKLR